MKNRLPVETAEPRTQACGPHVVRPLDVQQAAQQQFERWTRDIGRFLADHPRGCIALGLAIGVYLGCLIKRR